MSTERADRFRGLMAAAMGGDASRVDGGIELAADEERRGSRRVACYQLGSHVLLPADPEIVDIVRPLCNKPSLSDPEFRAWAEDLGASILGQAVMKLVGAEALRGLDRQVDWKRLDWSSQADIDLMQAFVDAGDPDDLEEAEIAMDDLDATALAVLQGDGSIGAYASSRAFEHDPAYGDIGIATATSARRRGMGMAAVSLLISEMLLPAGIEPLYRCDPENAGSDRLSSSLGFETVLSLTVAELPPA